jgi:predicted transcriptional regulator
MSLERVINALMGLGLSITDAEVYVYLAKKGPKTIEHLTRTLIYNKKEIKQSLNYLQSNGLLSKNRILYCALPFDEALEMLLENVRKLESLLTKSEIEHVNARKSNP